MTGKQRLAAENDSQGSLGQNVEEIIGAPQEIEVLASGSAAPLTTSAVMLGITSGGATGNTYEFDNVRILADGLSTTTTFAVNDADELVSATDTNGGTTYFEYDAWGRMVRKYMGASQSPTFEATYEYKYDDKLVAVTSNFPDEGSVSYTYGADGQRRSRTANGVTTKYNWSGFDILSEEDASGDVVKTFVGRIGWYEDDAAPADQFKYFINDQQGSVRAVTNAAHGIMSVQAYSPYGGLLETRGQMSFYGYTAEMADASTGLSYFYFRHYSPELCRWLSREPSGAEGPNLYFYAANNPSSLYDVLGLSSVILCGRPDLAVVCAEALKGGATGGATTAILQAARKGRCPGVTWGDVVRETAIGTVWGTLFGTFGGIGRLKSFADAAKGIISGPGSIAAKAGGRAAKAGKSAGKGKGVGFVGGVGAGAWKDAFGGGFGDAANGRCR